MTATSRHIVKIVQLVSVRRIVTRFVRLGDIRAVRIAAEGNGSRRSGDVADHRVPSKRAARLKRRHSPCATRSAKSGSAAEIDWLRAAIVYVPEAAPVLHRNEVGVTAAVERRGRRVWRYAVDLGFDRARCALTPSKSCPREAAGPGARGATSSALAPRLRALAGNRGPGMRSGRPGDGSRSDLAQPRPVAAPPRRVARNPGPRRGVKCVHRVAGRASARRPQPVRDDRPGSQRRARRGGRLPGSCTSTTTWCWRPAVSPAWSTALVEGRASPRWRPTARARWTPNGTTGIIPLTSAWRRRSFGARHWRLSRSAGSPASASAGAVATTSAGPGSAIGYRLGRRARGTGQSRASSPIASPRLETRKGASSRRRRRRRGSSRHSTGTTSIGFAGSSCRLCASGNREPLTAVAYGIYPSERARLEAAGVDVVALPDQWSRGRACGGSAIFSMSLRAGQRNARGLLGCRRRPVPGLPGALVGPGPRPSRSVPGRPGAGRDRREPRDRALDQLHPRPAPRGGERATCWRPTPFINAGFAAGTVRALLAYFREADRLLNTDSQRRSPLGRPGCHGHVPPHEPGALARDPRRLELLPDLPEQEHLPHSARWQHREPRRNAGERHPRQRADARSVGVLADLIF